MKRKLKLLCMLCESPLNFKETSEGVFAICLTCFNSDNEVRRMTYKMVSLDDIKQASREKASAYWYRLAEKLMAERDSMRTVAIKYRTLWGELAESVGSYAEMPRGIDAEAARIMEKESK